MKQNTEKTRKITVNLPVSLIDGLAESENKSLTEVLRDALKQYRQKRACEALIKLRGTGGLMLTYEELKELRD